MPRKKKTDRLITKTILYRTETESSVRSFLNAVFSAFDEIDFIQWTASFWSKWSQTRIIEWMSERDGWLDKKENK